MRDVQLLPAAQDANTPGFIVLQWNQDNAAVWPFHCHIAWYVLLLLPFSFSPSSAFFGQVV